MEKRIFNWKNKFLSFAGRLQLIISVLSSLHVYWSLVFILPSLVTKELEAKMRGFLWCQGALIPGKAKVSWSKVCLPKLEGGLGIRRVGDMNKALMGSLVWRIVSKRKSLWVDWVYNYHIKTRSFWNCHRTTTCSWSWRKIMQVRSLFRDNIRAVIGDGNLVSAWFDSWNEYGPICRYISPRMIYSAGYHIDDKVADVWRAGNWICPLAWRDVMPVLITNNTPVVQQGQVDKHRWAEGSNIDEFSNQKAWNMIRNRSDVVNWCKTIWFSQCIPKHAFMLWITMRERLTTQDRIRKWNVKKGDANMLCCLLCQSDIESHNHLFFECEYTKQVWMLVREKAGMPLIAPAWADVKERLIEDCSSKSMRSVVGRLVVAATVYNIWAEGNMRQAENLLKTSRRVADKIIEDVRYKLMSLKIKNLPHTIQMFRAWGIDRNYVHDDGG